MLLIFVQNMLAALAIIFAKTALSYSQPLFYISMRLLLSGLFLTMYRFFFGQPILFRLSDWYLFAQVIVIQLCLAYTLEAFAIPYLTTAHVCILYNLAPLFAALFSYLLFHEYMTKKKWLGLFIGLLGFTPLLLTHSPNGNADSGIFSIAGVAVFFAVVLNTYGYIILRFLIKKRQYSPVHITALSLIIAGMIMGFISLIVEMWSPVPFKEPRIFFSYLLLVVVVGNIFAYNLYVLLLKKYTATFVAFTGTLFPIFGAIFGWLFFSEPITGSFLVTLVMVSAGLYIFYTAEEKE